MAPTATSAAFRPPLRRSGAEWSPRDVAAPHREGACRSTDPIHPWQITRRRQRGGGWWRGAVRGAEQCNGTCTAMWNAKQVSVAWVCCSGQHGLQRPARVAADQVVLAGQGFAHTSHATKPMPLNHAERISRTWFVAQRLQTWAMWRGSSKRSFETSGTLTQMQVVCTDRDGLLSDAHFGYQKIRKNCL